MTLRRSTAPCGTSWLICSLNSAPATAGLRRMEPSGGKRAGTWELATSRELMRCPFRFNGERVASFMNVPGVERSFHACAELNERSPVWTAAVNITAESSRAARSCGLCQMRNPCKREPCHPEPRRRRGTSQTKWGPQFLIRGHSHYSRLVTFPFPGSNNSCPRSFHVGFSARTNSFFFSRRHPLISFSRAMADRASLNRS